MCLPSLQRPLGQSREGDEGHPQSIEEVRWVQMDIIMKLCAAGAPTLLEDSNGDSASDRACRRLEDPFLEGAMLLGTSVEWVDV